MPATELANSNKNILDGELLWKYLHLSMMEKAEMAKRIGTTVEQVRQEVLFHELKEKQPESPYLCLVWPGSSLLN